MPTCIQEVGHVCDILIFLESVADDDEILIYKFLVLQALDKIQIIS